jgi:hypothetical protein
MCWRSLQDDDKRAGIMRMPAFLVSADKVSTPLFNHLVGGAKQRLRNAETERFGGL